MPKLCCPHCLKPIFIDNDEVDGYIFRHNILVKPSGESIKLYNSALLLFKLLLLKKGDAIHHDRLIDIFYGNSAEGTGGIEAIRVNVANLRKMIQRHKLPFVITTCFRFGYKLDDLSTKRISNSKQKQLALWGVQ